MALPLTLARRSDAGSGIWRAALVAHRWPLRIAGAYLGASLLLGPWLGWHLATSTIWQPVYFLGNGAALVGCYAAAVLVWRRLRLDRASGGALRAAVAWRLAWRQARRAELTSDRLARAAVLYALASVVSLVFAAWKPAVADRGFTWDAPLITAARALHGGRLPWEWLWPVIGHSWAIRAIDAVYGYGWTASQSILLWVLALAAPSAWRTRVLVTFLLSWVVVGSAAALALSSAGPIFVARVHGRQDFAPLVAHLEAVHRTAPLGVIETRDYLWAIYQHAAAGLWPGISAMPSMHVASTAVVTLAAQTGTRRPWVRALAWAFLIVMLVGSVALAWHYALDGYVSIAAVCVLWWLAGRLTRPA